MKKLLSVLMMTALLLCCTVSGYYPLSGSTAEAASAAGYTLTSIKEETIPAVPAAPHEMNIIMFGFTYGSGLTSMLEELSQSTLLQVKQYHFIFAEIKGAAKSEVVQFSAGYSSRITFCYGNNASVLQKLIRDRITGTTIPIPTTVFVDASGEVREMLAGYQSATILADVIKSIMGDRYIEPPKDPAYITANVKGRYLGNDRGALARINEIRYEACEEGVPNPNDPSKPLTLDDYHPVVWASELEAITRLRAAEGIIRVSPQHIRPNGKSCFTADAKDVGGLCAENLAYNSGDDVLTNLEQFYNEKNDWVDQTGGMTGHYESLINPDYYSTAVSGFYSDCCYHGSCVCCWMSSKKDFSHDFDTATDELFVPIEVETAIMSNFRLEAPTQLEIGSKADITFLADTFTEGRLGYVYLTDDITWSSSDKSILSVSNGVVTGTGAGTATVTASTFNDKSATSRIKVVVSTVTPSINPTEKPTEKPTERPTEKPTEKLTETPTEKPTEKVTEKPTQQPSYAPTVLLRGDADGDLEITILDATAIQRALVNLPNRNYIAQTADADNDGSITILDATAIQRHIANLPAYQGIGSPLYGTVARP